MFGRHKRFRYFNPLHHVVVKQRHPAAGLTVPALWVRQDRQSLSLKTFAPVIDLCIERSNSSYMTLRKPVIACGLLLDYVIQIEPELALSDIEDWGWLKRTLLNDFCNCLVRGTTESSHPEIRKLDWSGGCSPSVLKGYGWGLDRLFEFLGDSLLEGRYRATPAESSSDIASWIFSEVAQHNKSREFSFLSHLRKPMGTQTRKAVGKNIFPRANTGDYRSEPVTRLSVDLIKPLITTAFVKRPAALSCHEREDVTGQLAAALSLGGQRGSETLHFWVDDVQPKGSKVIGVLRHPQFYRETKFGPTRQEILLREYGLLPRNLDCGRFAVGWKHPMLNKQFWARITWMPIPGFQAFLAKLLLRYLIEIRRPTMASRRAVGLPDHPWLLVTTQDQPSRGVNIGDPYTRVALRHSWRRAILRLAKLRPNEDLRFGKREGTTPHGARHSYGYVFGELGASPKELQRLMHHVSILSQQSYRQQTEEEINKKFEEFSQRNSEKFQSIFGSDEDSFDSMLVHSWGI
jgi:hypothetical protein